MCVASPAFVRSLPTCSPRLRRWRADQPQCIRGGSLLRFDAQGLVQEHRDYWDTAEELYEKLPVLGVLMRGLRRAGAAPQAQA